MLNEVNAFVSTDKGNYLVRPSIPGRGRGAGSILNKIYHGKKT
jgi:hypothetical protein